VSESLPTRAVWSAYLALNAPVQARFPFRSSVAIDRAARRRVRRAAEHAYTHVPYYRETMDRLGFRPGDFRAAGDLARLPVIEREELQRDPEYFVSRARPIDTYVPLRSGGSSGAPVTVFHDPFALFQGACHGERARTVAVRLAGKRFRLRQMTVSSPLGSDQWTREAFERDSLIPRSIRVVEKQLSLLDPVAQNVRRIDEFRPDLLRSYGSYLEALFLHLRADGAGAHPPKVVSYASDALSDSVRRLITEDFGIPVVSTYEAIEAFHIGFECEEHAGLHLNVDLYPLAIVDAEGRELPAGSSGDVVVSNLVNRGTVLLNYRIGDVAARLPNGCRCGRNLPLLSFLEGRVDDWLESPSGELLHPQAVRTLFTEEEEIWRYQVIQHDPSRFSVAVVAMEGCDREGLRDRLARRFAERFGEGTSTEVSFVSDLPRTEGGKVRPVVSARVRARVPSATLEPFVIERAAPGDRDDILAVMRPANMHHVPSPEMEELDLERFFVARVDGRVVGAAGYTILGPGHGKTTLLAVLPAYGGRGIGTALQRARLDAMHRLGVTRVTTNADRPEVIAWYERRFGYRRVGELRKLIPFGDPGIERWVTLELDLSEYMRRRPGHAARAS
jgi:phenylacetate-CoA ligase